MNPDTDDHTADDTPTAADQVAATAGSGDVLLWAETDDLDRLTEGAGHLLDLVAVADHLARGLRHRFTIWDALEEALRWWNAEQHHVQHDGPVPTSLDGPGWDEPDSLHTTLRRFLYLLDDPASPPAAVAFQQAVRRWTTAMAEAYNRSHAWPHPSPRRTFPPHRLLILNDKDDTE